MVYWVVPTNPAALCVICFSQPRHMPAHFAFIAFACLYLASFAFVGGRDHDARVSFGAISNAGAYHIMLGWIRTAADIGRGLRHTKANFPDALDAEDSTRAALPSPHGINLRRPRSRCPILTIYIRPQARTISPRHDEHASLASHSTDRSAAAVSLASVS